MTLRYLVTHSGGFHADEVFATVILTRLFPEAEVVRSRKPEWITPGADRIVYDVGGAFDPEAGIFDHHQRGAPERDDGQAYSAFGLIWRHFGQDYLRALSVPDADVETVFAKFEDAFVVPIDMVDTGTLSIGSAGKLSAMALPGLIETLKPVFDETDPQAETRGFESAVQIARSFVEARVARSAAKLRAESMALAAIDAAGESPILELPMGMPFRPAVVKSGADHLLFAVTPRGEEWSLGGIRKDDEGFAQRADLPEAWAGLTGSELEAASGIPGALFCHRGRFIATASSREAILAMAQKAVEEATKA